METYSKYSPTPWDTKGLNKDTLEIGDWGVLIGQNRDSGPYERANFQAALESLGGEGDNVQVHRFGHWACGWFEIIVVKPNTPEWDIAKALEARLEDYPLLDEELESDLEYEENTQAGMVLDENGEWVYPPKDEEED